MKKIIFMICFASFFLLAQGQNEVILRNVFTDLYRSDLLEQAVPYYAVNKNKRAAKMVSGSLYLSEEWENGLLLMADNQAHPIRGRYDIYHDEMQLFVEGQAQAVLPKQIKAIALGDRIFAYQTIETKEGDLTDTYVEVLVEGPIELFVRRVAKTKKANLHPVLGSTNDDFKIVVKEELYFRKGNKQIQWLKPKKKSILKVLSKKKKRLTQFAKKENLNLKKRVDLIRLFEFYNQK